ncbi:MAG TPA: alkaline phosphatase family protein [Verrucomicrobiae bacterium]|nr:alkaline phosphatase family protein [Verrucomicrobiae bacterium]
MNIRLLLFVCAIAVSACSSAHPAPFLPASAPTIVRSLRSAQSAGKIQHIVFIVQENRTFDNIFGGPKPFPGADAVSTGQTLTGSVPLSEIQLAGGDDPNNYHTEWLWACNPSSGPPFVAGGPSPCRMNGLTTAASPAPGYTPPAPTSTLYSYVDYSETKPYWDIAKTYALGDHFFMAHNSETFTAHQYIFSAQSNNMVDAPVYPAGTDCSLLYALCAYTPWGCDSPSQTATYRLDPVTGKESLTNTFPCFGPGSPSPSVSYRSIADLVGAKGLTWRLYTHSMCADVNGLDVNGTIRYGQLWPTKANMTKCHTVLRTFFPTKIDTANFRVPESTILTDVAGSGGGLANVTWVLPGPLTSDHPGVPLGKCGPTWVAKVVNAIGASKYWNSTAIFIFWDDWGGFYDHVPPYVVRDQAGPGFRVPLLVVSPYARQGVAHTNVEVDTLLNFTESTFGLGSLGAADASPYLNNLNAFFDFQAAPKPFERIPVPVSSCSILEQRNETDPHSRWLRMIDDD